MLPRLLAFVFSVSAACTSADAQYAKTIHTTFPAVGVERVKVAVADSLTVGTWAGNVILVQTDVRLFNTTEGLFRHLTGEAGRYRIASSREGTTLNIVSEEPERRTIDTSVGVLEEEIHVKVLLPEDYIDEGGGSYVLEAEEPGR